MTDVDWDLLADHLGGALQGTPEEARVAHLIATDPAWQQAAERMTAALDAVAVDLTTLADPGGMPAAVEARLTEALAAAGSAGPASFRHPAPDRSPRAPSPPPRCPGGETGPRGRRQQGRRSPRRRRAVWLGVGGVLAGAAMVAVALGAVGGNDAPDTDPRAVDAPEAAPDAQAPTDTTEQAESASGQPLMAPLTPQMSSGTDYRPGTVTAPPEVAISTSPDEPASSDEDRGIAGVPPELSEVWRDPTTCITAVTSAVPGPRATVELLDFAYFQGEPAVVAWLATADGTRWVHVAGPACGSEHAGADTRYQHRIS